MNYIHVYSGDGKGKTTAALGLMLRFLGAGGKAALIQFDKGAGSLDFYGERRLFPLFPGLTHHATGLVRFVPSAGTFRFKNLPGDFLEAQKGLGLAHEALDTDIGLLILDEILSLPLSGLLDERTIMDFLDTYESKGRPCELVLTGHKTFPELEQRTDLWTRMQGLKHYFEKGVSARKGIEF